MPSTSKPTTTTPTHIRCRVIGREGAGVDGANGGICFYDAGKEFRCQPGDVVDIPTTAAAGYLTAGLVERAADVTESQED